MKIWIVAKTHYRGSACVHGLTEDHHHTRLLQTNGTYPSARTAFEVGQVWDLTFSSSPTASPHIWRMSS